MKPFVSTLLAAAIFSAPGLATADSEEALEFLRELEQEHAELNTLSASFSQAREDLIFGDIVEAEGRFWYAAPDRFRANYEGEASEQIWMLGDELVSYVPSMNQVDIVTMESGEDAPVHRLLLGFGADVDRILEIFDVAPAEESPEGVYGIAFESKDLSRSMEYGDVVIWFDEESRFPRVIKAEDDSSIFTIQLRDIELNPEISEERFQRNWPTEGVDINRHEGAF